MHDRRTAGQLIIALAVLALGAGVIAMMAMVEVSPIYSRVGPRLFPFMVGGLMAVMGLLLLRDLWAGAWHCEATDPEAPGIDWKPLGLVAAGLVLNILLIDRIGFILASTIMFTLVAKAFAAPKLWKAALIGFILAAIAYFGFADLLGLRMGDDPIEEFVTSIFAGQGTGSP